MAVGASFFILCVVLVVNPEIVPIFEKVLGLNEEEGCVSSVSKNKVYNA